MMDHGRRTIHLEVPFTSLRAKSPIVAVNNPFCTKDKHVLKNNRFGISKKWVNRHCSRYEFSTECGRMKNKLDTDLSKCETMRIQPAGMKNLLKHAKFLVQPDKWQGNQIFPNISSASSDREISYSPVVRPAHTKNELDSLPTFECGKMGSKTRKDDLSNLSGKFTSDWVKSSHSKKKSHKMTDDVKILRSNDLVIRGRNLINEQNENVIIKTPIISIMDTSVEDQSSEVGSEESLDNPERVVTLKVDWLEITKNDSSIFESTDHDLEKVTWTMNFSNKINERSKKCIYFENKGTVAISYRWRDVTPRTSMPCAKTKASFYFNKNEALILPGQKVEFVVWFYKRKSGISSELWCMKTEPVVSKESFFLRMRSSVDSEDSSTSQSKIDSYLDYCIRNTTVQQTVDKMIRSVRSYPRAAAEPMYKDLYLQEELFSAENPSYFYHSDLMKKFYRLYETALASDNPPEKFSLINMRKVLLKIEDASLRQSALEEFSDLCRESLRPRLLSTSFNPKHAMIYNVLCVFFDKMEEESEFVKENCILKGDNSSEITKNDVEIGAYSTWSNAHRIRTNSIPKENESSETNESTYLAVYREMYYIRIYKLLEDAIYHACAIIDSLNNLEGSE